MCYLKTMDKTNTNTMTLLTDLTETEMQELAEQFATFCDDVNNDDMFLELSGDEYADAILSTLS